MALSRSPIELDTTLQELYDLDGGDSRSIALLYAFPPGVVGLPSSEFHSCSKYGTQIPYLLGMSPGTIRALRNCGSQHNAFTAGAMDVYLFDAPPVHPSHRADAEETYKRLVPRQRNHLSWVECIEDVAKISKTIAVFVPLDILEKRSTLVDSDVHFDLLSKRTLAESGLPTPETVILDSVFDAESDASRDAEAERMICEVQKRPLPFVLKLPQGGGGAAVFLIKNDTSECVKSLRENLPRILPTCLLLQEVVPNASFAISIFVTASGRPIFISCSEEVHAETSTGKTWLGGIVDYPSQENLSKRYEGVTRKVAAYVYSRGYTGPLGFDVMSNDKGEDLVIDLNARPPGSFALGVLKGHFWHRNSLPFVSLFFPVVLPGDRAWFETRMWSDIAAGRILILGWCHGEVSPHDDRPSPSSVASIVVAGATRPLLMEAIARLRALEAEV